MTKDNVLREICTNVHTTSAAHAHPLTNLSEWSHTKNGRRPHLDLDLLVLIVAAQQHCLLVVVLTDGGHTLTARHELALIAQRFRLLTAAVRSDSATLLLLLAARIVRIVRGDANAARVLAACN